MTSEPRAEITTILFTDLVSSTDLVQRIGDEAAQGLFEQHHDLLRDLVTDHGGKEIQWLGDGLMAAFASTAEAVRCAIAMQRGVHRGKASRDLSIRVGLNVGEILRQESGSGYFGTPVIVARRLCDRAEAGEIICSSTVSGLLAGRKAFRFEEIGALELKGIDNEVAACRVLYDSDTAGAVLDGKPFVGRAVEIDLMLRCLEDAAAGQGKLLFVVGEPGIGKTRLTEEFAAAARRHGALVLWGRCYEGESAAPYAPFAEAISDYVRRAELDRVTDDLGRYGGVLAALAPAIREQVPDLPQSVQLAPDEERHRLFDAVVQLLLAIARRETVVLVLDDLHWADGATIALLSHVARFVGRGRLLIVGTYRDVELGRSHPFADALATLRREPGYERVALKGLANDELGELVAVTAARDLPRALVDTIAQETDGNPFFAREIIVHLAEEGKLEPAEGGSRADLAIDDLGIPEGVRQVVGQRLSRLSDEANRLLGVACAFSGAFCFEVARRVAELDEHCALDGVDEALEAQILGPTGDPETYEFSHALIGHTMYTEMNPSRQVRVHRRIAEQMEEVWSECTGEHAAQIAEHYYLSAALPGAERGVAHCLVAADSAERAAAHEQVAAFLRMALELMAQSDTHRPRVMAHLGLALARSVSLQEATNIAGEAAALIAADEGPGAAADYLVEAADAVWGTAFDSLAWRLAQQGLDYVGERRDITWFALCGYDLSRREAEDPDSPGIHLDSPERRELGEWTARYPVEFQQYVNTTWSMASVAVSSREEIQTRFRGNSAQRSFVAGEYRLFVSHFRQRAIAELEAGQLASAALAYTVLARIECAVGELDASTRSYAQALELSERLPRFPFLALQMGAATMERNTMIGGGSSTGNTEVIFVEALLTEEAIENRWVMGVWRAVAANLRASLGHDKEALAWLELALPAIERGPGWAINYVALVCVAANTLWALERCDHIEAIERNLREKVIAPDFRYLGQDGRLALAKVLALQGRFGEAREWFTKARRVLEEEGAQPLRAIVDFEEALAHVRRSEPGDYAEAVKLLDAALGPFQDLGMTGWQRRAEQLRTQCLEGDA